MDAPKMQPLTQTATVTAMTRLLALNWPLGRNKAQPGRRVAMEMRTLDPHGDVARSAKLGINVMRLVF